MKMNKSVEMFKNLSTKQCPECGEVFHEQVTAYLAECDRCLSKREE